MLTNYLSKYENNRRIVIIGDVHGDIRRFKNILINASIINTNLEWIADPFDTIVVQLGDQIDSLNRNTTEQWEVLTDYEMIYFTEHLNDIAKTKGGAVISLIGNHELMNILGDFSYVSASSKTENRLNMFKPKGSLALLLAKRPVIIKIRDLLFCHAKFNKYHYDLLKKYNKDINYLNYIWKNFLENNVLNYEDKELFDEIIIGNNGILWNRHVNDKEKTSELYRLMKLSYMFLGHTAYEKINIIDNQIFYCDTGISRAFGKKKYQYVDIIYNNINIKTIYDD